jgi:endonuclease YncB( thermonuclease family)
MPPAASIMKEAKLQFVIATSAALLCASCSASSTGTRQVNAPRAPSSTSGYESKSRQKSPLPTFSGRVVSIEDGDTIIILDADNRTYKIRLQGIDAPEGGQAFGDRSRQHLSDEVFGKEVVIEWSKRDRYGRIVGKVLLDGRDVCLEQIRAGMAWHYKYYQAEQSPEDRTLYADAEDQARAMGRGLWTDVNPTPPWAFRQGR